MHRTRIVLLAAVVTVATIMTVGAAGAAGAVQRCTGPASSGKAGDGTISPGLNGLATPQSVSMKMHVAQCVGNGTQPTEVNGTLKTAFTTFAQSCSWINAPHTRKASMTITWKNLSTSTVDATFSLGGSTRLLDISGPVTSGVFAGHSVTGQFRYQFILSPHGRSLPDACANKVAPGQPARISVVGMDLFRTKALVIT